MTNKSEQAYQHIMAVRGVARGLLTLNDVLALCDKYELSPEESDKLQSRLSKDGISLLTLDEKVAILTQLATEEKKQNLSGISNTSQEGAQDDYTKHVVSEERIIELANKAVLKLQWSDKMIHMAKEYIRDSICYVSQHDKLNLDAPWIISSAIVKIGMDITKKRMATQGINRGFCGFYTNNITASLRGKYIGLFALPRLNELLEYCLNHGHENEVMEAMLICLAMDIRPVRATMGGLRKYL